jgi:biotin carboxylase
MKNVFVLGLDELHRPLLEALPAAQECRFHGLLDRQTLRHPEEIPFERLLEQARARLDGFPDSVDGIAGYWDFPVSCLVPILCAERGLPAASLDAVLHCEHKYWSRVLQREVVPEHVPRFQAVDPFDVDVAGSIEIEFPFWLKPVKSWNSYLGFLVEGPDDLEHALDRIRKGLPAIARPFDDVLARAELPPEIAAVDGRHCIAEAIISSGRQCTVEGWAFEGEVEIFGTVDSIRHEGVSTFARYEYPSTLPKTVRDEMGEVSRRLMRHLGYEGAAFNIEYFWDEAREALWLLEVNARISQSHSELFAHVDGAANHAVVVDLALGRRPAFPKGEGPYPHAAKFYERTLHDAVATRVPSRREIHAIEERIPGTRIHVLVREGMRLSELGHQESYSYEWAWVYIGGESEADLLRKHDAVVEALEIGLEPASPEGG